VITAQAADSTGATASKSITITVTSTTSSSSGTSPAITLTASGSKVKGRQTANLSWTGAASATVDVYRNNVRIVTTANDGAYTDSVVAGKGTYSYKVCEAGTSNCSATVNVRF
jgi:serine protease